MEKKIIKKYSFFSALAIILLLAIWFAWAIYLPVNRNAKNEIIFNINKGEGLAQISSDLKSANMIKSKALFNVFALLKNRQNKLQAGQYSLSFSMATPTILNKFVQGNVVKKKITIIEGWTLKNIAGLLEKKNLIENEEQFFDITGKLASVPAGAKDFSSKFAYLENKPKNTSLEGYLFPDTYEVNPSDSPEEIINEMLKNFNQKITPELKEEIINQGKTLNQILTMASLIEKEVKTYQDKQIAAGILWKRMKYGWPLQVDASLTYLTSRGSAQITKDDKKIDSPYNTYKYRGLPPGPICNPGLESIKAAVYYDKKTPFWFYLTTKDGKTVFSETLRKHNIAKWKQSLGQ